MVDGLRVFQWGGQIFNAASGGDPVEIWTNTFHYMSDTGTPTPYVQVGQLGTILAAFINDAAAHIDNSVSFEFAKCSEVDIATGHWATIPTATATSPSSSRGAGSGNIYPLTTAIRVSIDNELRNPRARGGFYVPRPTLPIDLNGRWGPAALDDWAARVRTLFSDILASPGISSIGVYSHRARAYYPSTRLRIGNVPDNISRRKNALREAYLDSTL